MKLRDGVQYIGSPFVIPDCSRDDLPEFFKQLGFKTGAEIGVYKGEYTRQLAKAGLGVYAIDAWAPYEDFDRLEDARIERQEELYQRAKKKFEPYNSITIIRKKSMDALKDFEDESLDFVYIDANHRLKFAVEDIYEWAKKVRKGGIVAGHDYIHFEEYPRKEQTWAKLLMHARYAVDAYVRSYRIKSWYLLGRETKIKGEKRDRCRSWMWFKE